MSLQILVGVKFGSSLWVVRIWFVFIDYDIYKCKSINCSLENKPDT